MTKPSKDDFVGPKKPRGRPRKYPRPEDVPNGTLADPTELPPKAPEASSTETILTQTAHDFQRYRTDPAGYFRDVWGVQCTPIQARACQLILTPPYRLLIRSGHNVGKCIGHNEIIPLADGRRVAARELVGRPFELMTLVNGIPTPVIARAEWNAIEPVYKLTTETGRQIVRNAQHPLWAAESSRLASRKVRVWGDYWKPISEIEAGDLVAMTEELPCFGHRTMPQAELKVLAYLIGDGGITAGVTFTQKPGRVLEEFRSCAAELRCALKPKSSNPRGIDFHVVGNNPEDKYTIYHQTGKVTKHRNNPILKLLVAHGVMGKHSRDKFVPEEIFRLTRKHQQVFLNRLFATDGWASLSKTGQMQIGYCSVSERLCRDIQDLLLRFGVHARIRHRNTVDAWCVEIVEQEEMLRFCEGVGIFGKEEAVLAIRTKCLSRPDNRVRKWRRKKSPAGTRWETVRSIEILPPEPTVAIEVPEHHTFLTSFWEHNTLFLGGLTSWHFDCFPGSATITTAPTHKDVVDLLWREIRVRRARAGLGGMVGNTAPEMRGATYDHYAKGFTAERGESFSGRHQHYMGFAFDESTGIDALFWETVKTMFQARPGHWWVCCFNPLDLACQAYKEERRGGWHVLEMSALDHPNITAELEGLPAPVPGATSLSQVNALFKEFCDPVPDIEREATDILWPPSKYATRENPCLWYRPSPQFDYRVLGRWPSGDVFGVWSRRAWQLCLREYVGSIHHSVLPEFGVDTATTGEDYTAIHGRVGPVSFHHERHNGWLARQTAERLKILCKEASIRANENLRKNVAYAQNSPKIEPEEILVKVDADANGVNVVDAKGDFRFVGIGASQSAIRSERFYNRRAEVWFEVAELARSGQISVASLPHQVQQTLEEQILSVTWKPDIVGRQLVEPKEETRKRLRCSPDDADAFLLAYYTGQTAVACAWKDAYTQDSFREGEKAPWEAPLTVDREHGPYTHCYDEDELRGGSRWRFGL